MGIVGFVQMSLAHLQDFQMTSFHAFLLLLSAVTNGSEFTPNTQSAEFDLADRAYAKADWATAKQNFEIACTDNVANACANLGVMNALGQGLPVDNLAAGTYYLRACNLSSGAGCANIGWIFEHGIALKRDPAKAAQYYQLSCNLDFSLGCRHLGNLHLRGQGVAQDTRLAIAYLTRALQLDSNIDRMKIVYP